MEKFVLKVEKKIEMFMAKYEFHIKEYDQIEKNLMLMCRQCNQRPMTRKRKEQKEALRSKARFHKEHILRNIEAIRAVMTSMRIITRRYLIQRRRRQTREAHRLGNNNDPED
ncbi:uncharacterized protein LOC107035646 isoform X1 [Diachasma alloeum]|uniref:uncharacterized protein LOC107035646 isoform X1 n=1 Tax=Diachasma alloeum TaxID=454923 RepID=UPI00073830D9|nr:uncharacterized protein LOC107035646 isoform X1 [Diachasma alloeum]